MSSALTILCRKCSKCSIIHLPKTYDVTFNAFLNAHKGCGDGYNLRVHKNNYQYAYRPTLDIISEYQQNVKRKLIGAEIGTLYGKNALNFLQYLDMKKFYLIDPYAYYDTYNMENRNENPESIYQSAKDSLKPYGDRIEFIRELSSKAVDKIPNELDFVYIDGNHEYDYVKQDLELYYPKIKSGGVMGGHDLGMHEPGVLQAVGEFVLKHKIDHKNRFCKSFLEDWYIIKQ